VPDEFFLTTPTTTITVGTNRHADFAVTVTNVTGRPVRARLRLVPNAPAVVEWFSIAGDAERDYGLGATQSYTVLVDVPGSVPAGTYSVRCDAVTTDPEEHVTQGPTVALTLNAAPVKKPFPWWIIVVAAAVLLVGTVAGVAIARTGDNTPTPTTASTAPTTAATAPTTAATTSPTTAATTSPTELVPVPGVVGRTITAAQSIIRAAGLVPVTEQLGSGLRVRGQDPRAGQRVAPGSEVTLFIGTEVTCPPKLPNCSTP
jgi:hypothetical protein